MTANPNILEMRSISKEFPGVKALDDVSIEVEAGEIHAIVGENGAGKSTLMKVLSGVYPYGSYQGDIVYQGEVVRFRDIRQSESAGIAIIHQELALIPELSITENIFLGSELNRGGVINWREAKKQAAELLHRVGLRDDPGTQIKHIGVGKQQLVEIAKALHKSVKLLILDEPTRGIDVGAKFEIYGIIQQLAAEGKGVIVISSELPELLGISDRIYTIFEGQITADILVADADPETLMRHMTSTQKKVTQR